MYKNYKKVEKIKNALFLTGVKVFNESPDNPATIIESALSFMALFLSLLLNSTSRAQQT